MWWEKLGFISVYFPLLTLRLVDKMSILFKLARFDRDIPHFILFEYEIRREGNGMHLKIPLYLAGLTDSILYPAPPCLWPGAYVVWRQMLMSSCTVLYCTVMQPHVSDLAPVLCGGRWCWARRVVSSLQSLKCKVYACPAWLALPHTGHFSLKLEEKPSLVKISLVGF